MRLVNTSVRRPVGVIMIVLAIIALGFVSARNLVIDLFPKIDFPVAVIATTYQDAAPEDVENLISRPLEASISSIEGIETVQSQSQSGNSLVLMMFKNGVDLDQALLDVRERVDQVKGFLPEQAGDPRIMRFSPDQLPVLWISLAGKDPEVLTELADDMIVPFFERQEGVASVTVEGGKDREIQLIIDETKLQQYGVSMETFTQVIASANQSASVGTIDKGSKDLQLRIVGEFTSLDDIGQTIVPTETGGQVHVSDIAEVKDSFKPSNNVTLVNGEQAVVLSILKKTDANTVAVANEVNNSLAEINAELPEGVHLETVIDTSEFIEMSVDSVISNMIIGGAISFLILLLFLKSIRATIVIGLSIPIAVISTFTLMYFTGETLNILTLGGLALGIGMMVDSSIVILENIYSYRQRGYSLFESATKGASELAPAVIASTTTTLVVFLPIVFVDGIASDLFTPLALTVSFSLIASLVVAVTLVPMLSSKLLSKAMEDQGKRYWFNELLERLKNGYERVLKGVLKYRKTTVFGTILAIAISLAFIPLIGAEFIPAADQGQIEISVETAPGSSLTHTDEIVKQVNEKLSTYNKYIETSYVSVGGGGVGGLGGSVNSATIMLQLIPPSERDLSDREIVQKIDDDFQTIPSAEITVSAMHGGVSFGDPISIELNGPEHEGLRQLAEAVVEEISTIEGVHNPQTAIGEGIPQLEIVVETDRAMMYGLTEQQIMAQVQMQFTGQLVTQYREAGREMDVRLLYPEEKRQTISDLQTMNIQTTTGAVIPLAEVATFKETQGPVSLLRENQQPQMNVSSDIMDRDLNSIVRDVEARLDAMNFPEGYSYKIGGEAENMAESFADLALALVFSIFLVYAVMAVQFENFLFPFIIMFSMPATIIGVILGLLVFNLPLSIPGFIGVIMLAGIVVNNSIVLVDYINILRRRGIKRSEAIIEAGRSRLRPILMTTLTTVLAMIPLGLAFGEGAEMQQPLAVTIIFGLSVSSIFTLLLIPVIYTMFDNLTAKISGRDPESPFEQM
ncbi:MAG TPA: efflux RND transporter permease subunit [Bacillota bacterium]|nr:efflux RND transporter permease subunit [Bacillota bacterium]